MRPQFAAALAVGCFLLSACGADERVEIEQRTQDRIAECGGGLRKYSGLSAALDTHRGGAGVSLGTRQVLEAAFIRHLGRRREEAVEIFKMYIDCVTGSSSMASLVQSYRTRWPRLREQLTAQRVHESALQEVELLQNTEIAALEKRDFLGARDTRNVMIKRIIRAVIDVEGSFDEIEFT